MTLFGAERQTPARLPRLRLEAGKVNALGGEPGHYTVLYANGSKGSFTHPGPSGVRAVTGPWTLQFQPGRGAPEQAQAGGLSDWSRSGDPAIRYFSGTATHHTEFDCPASLAQGRYTLSLGDVQVMAQVRLNGKDLGVLWKAPFEVDVSSALKPGRNELEVKVTNLWPNRMIGDEQFPDDCTPNGSWKTGPIPAWPEWLVKSQPRPEPRRLTFTTWKYYTKDSPLLPSGLLGQVTLRADSVTAVGSTP